MNITSAFVRGVSGSLTDSSAGVLNNYMNTLYQKYDNLTGWLGETLEAVKKDHKNFMESRMWEFSKRVGKDGKFVGRFEIGYLSEVQYQRQATGFMRDYIMANPLLMQLYEDDRVSGYDGDFHDLCTGIGRDNYFYNRAIDGKVMYNEEENTLNRTVFTSSRDNLTHLSFSERVDIHRTWAATNLHIAKNLFDPTSTIGGNILSVEEVEELRRKAEEEAQKDSE